MFIDNLEKVFKIKIITRNMKYYKNKGYECKLYDIIEVNMEDLPNNSSQPIKVLCDYCLENNIINIINIRYSQYLKNNSRDCCNECKYKKREEETIKKYGVKNISQLDDIKNKKIQTCLDKNGVEHHMQTQEHQDKIKQICFDKYGVEYYIQVEEIKERARKTNLERYGVENTFQDREKIKNSMFVKYGVEYSMQLEEVKEKTKQTNLEKYGVENYAQTEEFKIRVKQTNLEKYGVEYLFQDKEFYKKIIHKSNITKYEHNSAPCSIQQQYICDLYETKPNYPVSELRLDIAFPEEMIYIEYDGSGHGWWNLKNGKEKEFKVREYNRKSFLQKRGWKLIKIISKQDWLPSDEVIFNLIEECKNYLNTNHSWIEIDIDKSEIRSSKLNKSIELGELRKIKKKDVEKDPEGDMKKD